MTITAKELAKKLNLSAAAVSMALNDKQGVSKSTRELVMAAAEEHGYDFSRFSRKKKISGTICFIMYRREGAVVGDTPFFSQLTEGIETECKTRGFKLRISYLYKNDDLNTQLGEIMHPDCDGIILLGTEMLREDLKLFEKIKIPLVLLDVYFDSIGLNSVLINNVQGAFMATDYLIKQTKSQPGYLHSSYYIENFEERADGFYKAVRHHGMSTSKSIVHRLAPSVEGAFSDMLEILRSGEDIARCYFADNDFIAIGALKAFREFNIRVPEKVAIVGFDNVPMSAYIDPPLSTINVPKQFMGERAVIRIAELIDNFNQGCIKIEICTKLIKRKSS
jgi:LacI family transcriptional regulator